MPLTCTCALHSPPSHEEEAEPQTLASLRTFCKELADWRARTTTDVAVWHSLNRPKGKRRMPFSRSR